MRNIKDILNSAKSAIDLMDNGKTYTSEYASGRFIRAADGSPGDQLISHMRDVIVSASSKSDYITQSQIGRLYDEMYGLSGGQTSFRDKLGDMLPANHNVVEGSSYDYSSKRVVPGMSLDTSDSRIDELSESFASIFSLKGGAKPGLYGKGTADRVKNMVSLQLASLGCYPSSISASRQNEHYILCTASFDSEDWSNVSVKIPVQVTGGVVREPASFVNNGELVDLTKSNLYPYMKEESHAKKSSNQDNFARQRRMDSIGLDSVVTPASLESIVDIDSSLVSAASKFSSDQVNNARSIVIAELSSVGIRNSQVKVYSADDKSIKFSARIPTGSGGVDVFIPVEVSAGIPMLPSRMIVSSGADADKVYEFNEKSFHTIVANNSGGTSRGPIRDTGELLHMSYHGLIDNMINGVANGDYRLAEDSLAEVGNRFDSDHYLSALDKFTMLLKTSSHITNFDDSVVKKAFANGHLINTPTSVEPYCPILGLPLSKIYFDENGRPTPKRAGAKSDNLSESGVGMLTSKIVIT